MAFQRIVVTGASGMLGRDLTHHLSGKGYQVTGLTSQTCNLLHDVDAIRKTIGASDPQLIIHTAAYTDVEGAERDPELAMSINKDGTRKIALVAEELGAVLAYVSTDYVFDGLKGTPYTVEDKPNPVNAYGLSKYYGELMVKELLDEAYILRTSWLYGVSRHNFVQYVLEGARQGRELQVVDDWIGSPTWTGTLSHTIEQVVCSGAYGTYHTVDAGMISKYDQAVTICESAGLSTDHIRPVSHRDLSFLAKRPPCSALDPGTLEVPSWKTALQAYLQTYFNSVNPTNPASCSSSSS